MKAGSVITTVVIAAAVAVFAYDGLARHAPLATSAPAAADCTPEAIRQVADALDRSIRSAACAKVAAPAGAPRP